MFLLELVVVGSYLVDLGVDQLRLTFQVLIFDTYRRFAAEEFEVFPVFVHQLIIRLHEFLVFLVLDGDDLGRDLRPSSSFGKL